MSRPDWQQDQAPLPLRADPQWGVVVGTFLLAACLAGPVGLVLALVVLAVVMALKGAKPRGEAGSPQDGSTDDELATRFQGLEAEIVGDDRPSDRP